MKYYIVVTPFFPTSDSFRGPYIYDQVKAIQRTGKYNVLVFKPKCWNDKQDFYDYCGIRVYLFTAFQMPSYLFNGFLNRINCCFFKKRIKNLGLDLSNVAVVHGHTSMFGAYGLILKECNSKIKTIVQHHDRDPFTILNGRFASWPVNLKYRAQASISIFNKVDYHVSISEVVEDNLLSFPDAGRYETYKPYLNLLRLAKGLPKIKAKHSVVLYNGVDLSQFYPISGLRNRNVFKIGCVGNFQELKCQIVLIKAVELLIRFKSLSNICVSFIGSGPLLRECKAYVKARSLDSYISFENEVHHDKLIDYYNTLDLFVLPTCYEGFGCVFTEAAACGVPFMLCEHQGASEYISASESYKWLFPPYDYKKLSELIYSYYTNPVKQNLCHSYDINKLINNFLKEIDE